MIAFICLICYSLFPFSKRISNVPLCPEIPQTDKEPLRVVDSDVAVVPAEAVAVVGGVVVPGGGGSPAPSRSPREGQEIDSLDRSSSSPCPSGNLPDHSIPSSAEGPQGQCSAFQQVQRSTSAGQRTRFKSLPDGLVTTTVTSQSASGARG
jgi:hypothetical protein